MAGKTTTDTADTTGWVGGAKLSSDQAVRALLLHPPPPQAQSALPDTSAAVRWQELAKKQSQRLLSTPLPSLEHLV